MRRRDFLSVTSQATLSVALLPQLRSATGAENSASPADGARSATLIADMEKLIPKLMKDSVVAGLSIALVQDGKMSWNRSFGVKDATSNEPVTNDTVFEAASISKTVFAYPVLKLCEKGTIDLDTPLTRYTPERLLNGDPRLELITARHVLSHTSGLQNWRSRGEALNIHSKPGEKFLYSGEGYYYLQSVVTHLTGKVNPKDCAKYEVDYEVCATDFDPFMKRTLFAPFAMSACGYVWNDTFEKHVARPHGSDGKPLTKKKPRAPDAARYGSAGGLHTTAADYAKFLVEIVNPKPADEFRLGKKSLDEMGRPQVKLDNPESIDGCTAWGLGWGIQERPNGNLIVHSGGQEGFRSLTMASIENKSAFIILTNSDNGGSVINNIELGDLLHRLLFGRS